MQRQLGLLQIAGFVVVSLSMVEMFTIPRNYFVLGSIVSTMTMICVTMLLHRVDKPANFSGQRLAIGVVTAIVLYFVFFLGNAFIKNYSPLGMQPTNETSIYGLFSSSPVWLLVAIFLLDALGFESYFRGNLQRLFGSRLHWGAVFLPAVIDAVIHFSSLNPLFPATTFVADCFWGLNYYHTKDIYSNYTSHFVWDLLIFLVFPIH
ncbi:MAG: CPBP family intramembrane metalloprotease [Nitrososphaerota archaeon]|nr:CPBP family intramembrane metalloprotease [Nitrososphaerota archaeon]